MWSVWPETVDLYLGRELALLKAGSGPVRQLPGLGGNDLAAFLAQLPVVPAASRLVRGRLRVAMGASVCPAIGFEVPGAVQRWGEVRAIAQAHGAAALHVEADALLCEVDPTSEGIAAALPSTWVDTLRQWAFGNHWALVSVAPLWGVASTHRALALRSVESVLVREPDAVTLLAPAHGRRYVASTLALAGDAAQRLASERRWLVGQGASAAAATRLAFSAVAHVPSQGEPMQWRGHWKVVQ